MWKRWRRDKPEDGDEQAEIARPREARIIVVRVLEMWENSVPYTFEEVSRLNHSYHIVTRMQKQASVDLYNEYDNEDTLV